MLLTICNYNDELKEDDRCGSSGTFGGERMLMENAKERENLENFGGDGKITLNES